MKIIDFSSGLQNGSFIYRFTFEDDTDVFFTPEGWECVNFNNIKEDVFYIELAQKFYNQKFKN